MSLIRTHGCWPTIISLAPIPFKLHARLGANNASRTGSGCSQEQGQEWFPDSHVGSMWTIPTFEPYDGMVVW